MPGGPLRAAGGGPMRIRGVLAAITAGLLAAGGTCDGSATERTTHPSRRPRGPECGDRRAGQHRLQPPPSDVVDRGERPGGRTRLRGRPDLGAPCIAAHRHHPGGALTGRRPDRRPAPRPRRRRRRGLHASRSAPEPPNPEDLGRAAAPDRGCVAIGLTSDPHTHRRGGAGHRTGSGASLGPHQGSGDRSDRRLLSQPDLADVWCHRHAVRGATGSRQVVQHATAPRPLRAGALR